MYGDIVISNVFKLNKHFFFFSFSFLLFNQFVWWQNFLTDEDISRMKLLRSSKECTH